MNPINLLFTGAILLGLVAVVLVSTRYRNIKTCCRLLAAYFFIFIFLSIYNILLETGWINKWPYLLGLDLPFYFLPSTIGYLYVRTLTTRKPFRFQSDWWRFLPVLLCMVDLSPLLLVGMAEKKEQVVQLVKGEASTLFQAGSITGFQFYLPVLLAVGLYHLLGILSMLTRYKILLERNLRNREDDQQQQPKLFQWLGSFTGLFTVFWLINSIDFIKTADDFTLTSFTQFQRIGTACILILTVVFFLLKAIPIWKRLQTGQTGS